MSLKGTKTEKNLQEAFAGESMARNKYTYFASVAKSEGYNKIAEIFLETAKNEMEHAKLWAKELNVISSTYDNLIAAASGENGEWTSMYSRMAAEAREEGFDAIAAKFELVAKIEAEHEKRYLAIAEKVKNSTVFTANDTTEWICDNCGHVHIGSQAPKACPTCAHPQANFQIKANNY